MRSTARIGAVSVTDKHGRSLLTPTFWDHLTVNPNLPAEQGWAELAGLCPECHCTSVLVSGEKVQFHFIGCSRHRLAP